MFVAQAFSQLRVQPSRVCCSRRRSARSLKMATWIMAPDNPDEPDEPGRRDPSPRRMPSIPVPQVATDQGTLDIYSRLAKDRKLLLGTQVNDEVCNQLVAQMLFLAQENPEEDITLYINSPGGSVSAGLALYDTMMYVPCDVATVCFGTAASMGAFLLCAGAKGKRRALPHARIMIHQPLGGAQGQAMDIEIQAREILYVRDLINQIMAAQTGKAVEEIERDTDRDFFMNAEEAVAYGLIDEVVKTKNMLPYPKKPSLVY
ncbi:ATP-dependent Clp protease proteolytic subunit [Cyanidioschyzon merolae strain 10D]|jgi:ATP-dependent Clp protease protease subunit|uniref:ATP-dependent Clp protease proteolytic subunit n=1 Tax=Cyanidioschyzon merolae (strain NIES-3377 / 10D) TaxID=280699 RepID=M1VEK9_CYAM1|nr:ATP-dependent Clp protease proteolytic subunit [Cyanidioschyzon merolae strain 10D]BAM81327.1 ATP-dependent Clp protease proteolytic subunit [Cyanidioschyzon merolae strain 10D]|eukprot:XP_005537363.1 ATP-dependent Clp protease proteolytic subunit [Cyanidioschyzon merolae strain 10D]